MFAKASSIEKLYENLWAGVAIGMPTAVILGEKYDAVYHIASSLFAYFISKTITAPLDRVKLKKKN